MQKDSRQVFVVYSILFSTLIPRFFNTRLGTVLQLLVLGFIFLLIMFRTQRTIYHKNVLLGTLLVFIMIFIVSSVQGSLESVLRVALLGGMPVALLLFVTPSIQSKTMVQAIILFSVTATIIETIGSLFINKGGALTLPIINIVVDPLGFYLIGNSNAFGIFSALGFLGAVSFRIYHNSRQHTVYGVLCAIGLAFSLSRGAILVVGAGLFTIVITHLWYRKVAWLSMLTTTFGGIILFLAGINSNQFSLDLSFRSILWKSSLDLISQQPIFGYGYVDTSDVLLSYTPDTTPLLSPHNMILQLGIISGIIGVFLYMIIYISSYKNLIRFEQHDGAFAARASMLVGLLAAGSFSSITMFGTGLLQISAALVILTPCTINESE